MKSECGNQYGDLTVIESAGRNQWRALQWLCSCRCGNIVTVSGAQLRSGKTKSCGCRRAAECRSRTTHGNARRGDATKEYRTWCHMIERCHNKNSVDFSEYGGRGITVCDRWRNSFSAFLEDMGKCPAAKTSIDRKDNERGYEPGNCKWANLHEQANNKRNNRFVTINGVRKLAQQWCDEYGISNVEFYRRVRLGMTDEQAITTPKKR